VATENLRQRVSGLAWAMGAAAVLALGVVSIALLNGLFPGQHAVRGAVQNVDGSLYEVSDDQVG